MSNKLKILIVVLVIALILGMFIYYLASTPSELLPEPLKRFTSLFEKKYTPEDSTYVPIEKTILYHTADFSENIYNDEEYVDLISDYALEYVEENVNYKLNEDNLEKIGGDLALFFYNYFNDIRNGDCDKYNGYFDSRAFSIREKATDFTMQQIYDIVITPLNIEPDLDEKEYDWVFESGIEPVYVDVSYKIRKNNGTFRLGVDSDTAKPQLYIIYKDKNTYKIINIVDYSPIYL